MSKEVKKDPALDALNLKIVEYSSQLESTGQQIETAGQQLEVLQQRREQLKGAVYALQTTVQELSKDKDPKKVPDLVESPEKEEVVNG